MAAKLWTFLAAQFPTALGRERSRDAQLPARLACGDARPAAGVGTTDTALMNFAQKDIERTLDPDALQNEMIRNETGATQKNGWSRSQNDTKRH